MTDFPTEKQRELNPLTITLEKNKFVLFDINKTKTVVNVFEHRGKCFQASW